MNALTVADQLGELLLLDLRVVEARIAVLELGEGQGMHFPQVLRPILHLVLDGMAWLSLDDPDIPQAALCKGEMALVFYGDHHTIAECEKPREITIACLQDMAATPAVQPHGTAPPKAVVFSCILDLAYISPTALAVRAAPKLWSMPHDAARPGSRALAGDTAQWRAALNGPGANAFATMLASIHFVHAMRDIYRSQWESQPIEIRAPATRGVSASILAMHMQPGRPWTVASLAHEVGVSRSRFAAIFKENIGMPPLAYLTKIRMARAAQLLKAEKIPLPEIARRSGYTVQTSFTRAFIAFHGQSPTAFIRDHRASENS